MVQVGDIIGPLCHGFQNPMTVLRVIGGEDTMSIVHVVVMNRLGDVYSTHISMIFFEKIA